MKFPRSVLNLTCIVHSPEVPAAIFWKHNGQVLQHVFRLLETKHCPDKYFHLFHFDISSCWRQRMESRQLQGILFPRQNLFSLLLSQTLTRVESTSAGESYAQVHGISNALKNLNIALEKIYSESKMAFNRTTGRSVDL